MNRSICGQGWGVLSVSLKKICLRHRNRIEKNRMEIFIDFIYFSKTYLVEIKQTIQKL